MGADPGETAALLDAVRPRTAQAADRQAHAELRLAGGGRGGRRAARRRRRLARQHAARDGDAPAPAGRAVARRRHRRRVGPGRPRGRARAGRARSASASGSRSSAWAASRAGVTRATCSTRAQISSASGTESFRDPRAGARIAAELRQIGANSGIIGAPSRTRARAHSTKRLKNALQRRRLPSSALHAAAPQLEVQLNSRAFALSASRIAM